MKKILNYINGELREPKSKNFLDNINPAKGIAYSLVPDSDEQDVADAIQAASRAFVSWSEISARQRSEYLKKLAKKIAENLDRFAKAESEDSGKPITLAKNLDIPRARDNFDFFADEILEFKGETFKTGTKALNQVKYSPLGVVACISPWNLPLYLFSWKIAPALAAGNTVVAKPSELTPMTAFLLSELAVEIGLPPGVLNIVHGTGPRVGSPLVNHPLVKAISFTGSTATGKNIAQATAGSFKKLSLEMGGKNANIIFADCDFEKSVATTVRSSFLNQGQICLCGSRIFIEKSIYEKFKNALVEKTLQLRQGDPLNPETEQGALVSSQHRDKVLFFIDLAKKEGGKILCGGEKGAGEGYFVKPTLIETLPSSSKVNQEEIFGPVATLIPFDSAKEVIEMANSTRYGLSASLWSEDKLKAEQVALKLEAGIVWINTWMLRDLRTPFGGVKESGIGREGGRHALEFMSETKNICVGLE